MRKKPKMLECLKQLNEEDPTYAEDLLNRVYETLADGADVSPDELKAAIDRMFWDGVYGTCSDTEWKHTAGVDMPFILAKSILKKAYRTRLHEIRDERAYDSRDEIFAFYKDIYGHNP
jgi:hypothetical protein